MAGFTLDAASIQTLRQLIAWWRGRPKSGDTRPAIRYDDSWPKTVLVKLDSGQTLGTSAGDTATGKIFTGSPGSLAAGEPITVHRGDLAAGGDVIDDTTWLVCARINGYWQPIVPPTPGSAALMGEVEFTVDSAFAYAAGTFNATPTLVRGSVGSITVGVSIEVVNPVGGVNAHWFQGESGWTGWGTYDPVSGTVRARGVECGPTE